MAYSPHPDFCPLFLSPSFPFIPLSTTSRAHSINHHFLQLPLLASLLILNTYIAYPKKTKTNKQKTSTVNYLIFLYSFLHKCLKNRNWYSLPPLSHQHLLFYSIYSFTIPSLNTTYHLLYTKYLKYNNEKTKTRASAFCLNPLEILFSLPKP